jgi:hypothetical protein
MGIAGTRLPETKLNGLGCSADTLTGVRHGIDQRWKDELMTMLSWEMPVGKLILRVIDGRAYFA